MKMSFEKFRKNKKGVFKMQIVKWICFIITCLDLVGYVYEKWEKKLTFGGFLGVIVGILARLFVYYGAFTCWLLV